MQLMEMIIAQYSTQFHLTRKLCFRFSKFWKSIMMATEKNETKSYVFYGFLSICSVD